MDLRMQTEPATRTTGAPTPVLSRRVLTLGALAFAAVAVAALTWAKWYPYWHKLATVASTHTLGASILTNRSDAPPAPSWGAAVSYAIAYGRSIWIAMVAALLIAASVEAFLPRRWLLSVFQRNRGHMAGAVAGGVLSMPSMMCTCCASPLAVSLRRRGVPITSALAYWVGNPTLNPATLAFMAIVLPWQFVTIRLITGVVLVFGLTALVGRLAQGREVDAAVVGAAERSPDEADATTSVGASVQRFMRTLLRLSITLIPEYIVIVLLLGGLRGWLFPLSHGMATWGILAVVLLAIVGTLFVIPTAAEIPIVQGALAAGVGLGGAGALLVTLPAISLPSMVMVMRAFPARVIAGMAASVAVTGLFAAGILVLLG